MQPTKLIALLVLSLSTTAMAQSTRPVQKAEPFKTQITFDVDMSHLVYLPPDYGTEKQKQRENGKKWPLVIFLHGAGERGNDLQKIKAHGPPKLIETGRDFPFVLISPQCAAGKLWEPAAINALLDHALSTYAIDPDRVYLTGISMGGFGTWATAMAYPDRFAAIVPICGGGDSWQVGVIKHVPTWVFHGEKDPIVPFSRSQDMVKTLKRAGGDVRFTSYPNTGHDAWTASYENPELYAWLLTQVRKQPAP